MMLKYSSYNHPGILVYEFLRKIKHYYNERVGVVIIDMLDNLGIIQYQVEACGFDFNSVLNGVKILKVGGLLDVGDVKAKIRLSGTYVIHRGKFNVALEKVLSEFSDREFIVVIHIG